MTSEVLPLNRGALGTQRRAVEEGADHALGLLWIEVPRRGTSEDVPLRGNGQGSVAPWGPADVFVT